MLLVVDVGNTNITFGVFDGEKLEGTFRMTTKLQRTSDEYGICIRDLLTHNRMEPAKVRDVIIASVVPNVMHSLLSAFIKYFGIHPVVVEPGIKTGIRIATENPRQIGADRIVDGTTYDLVDETGAFVSGVTAPGIRTSAKALWEEAAKLPEIEIRKPGSILARETITSMQAGLIYGQIGQTEYIIRQTKKRSEEALAI